MENIIEVKNLRKEYNEFILKDISFSLPKGYILGIIGPNGAGKTTIINIIMNFISKKSGEIKIFGKNISENEKELKNRIGYVGEEQYFYENKTVDWTEKFVSDFYKKWDNNYFNSLLKIFNISRNKKINQLSKGMKVKLSLAIALSHNPELLILDEPTSGLDPVIRRELLDIIQNIILDKNKSVIISSHITDDLSRIADYILYLVNGEITLLEEKDILNSNWKKIHFKYPKLKEKLRSKIFNIEENPFGSSAFTNKYEEIYPLIKDDIDRENIKIENLSLDDILISFVKKDLGK